MIAELKERAKRVAGRALTDGIAIWSGDCREVLKGLEANSVHFVLTDPPYFLDGMGADWNDRRIRKSAAKAGVVGGLPVGMRFDKRQGIALQSFIGEVSRELHRLLMPGGFFVCFSQPRLFHRLAVGIEDAGFEMRDMLVWRYSKRAQAKAFSQNHFIERMNISVAEKARLKASLEGRKTPQLRPQFEAMALAQKPREGTFVENWDRWRVGLVDMRQTLDGKTPSTVMSVEKSRAVEDHPTPKPLLLLSHLIRLFTCKGQVVLDPFIGSGSTAFAAQNEGRRCIGIEIEPSYVELAQRQLEVGT